MVLDVHTLEAIREAARLISGAVYVTALTGAGVSVESGIRPFRGPGGLWTERGEPPMDGYQRFLRDPRGHWESSMMSRGSGWTVADAEPNPGHVALAELERVGVLRCLITQNIDDLHNRAGSRNVLEIHGNAFKLRCLGCGRRFPREGFDLSKLPPRCPGCGGVIKGDTVMFGEPIPGDVLQACQREAERSDVMLVAGTSAVVYPAAGLPITVRRRGGKIIEVNPLETELTPACAVAIRAPSGEALPLLVEEVKKAQAGK